MISRHPTISLLAIGVLLGLAIWVFSPWLAGNAEPWDAETPIWLYSWVLIAVLGGLFGHVRGVCLPLGYALGQMLMTIEPVFIGEFWQLGWTFIAGYAVVAIAVTLTLAGVTALLKRPWRLHRSKDNDI